MLDADTETRYLNALCADLESALPQIWGRRVRSVFMAAAPKPVLATRH